MLSVFTNLAWCSVVQRGALWCSLLQSVAVFSRTLSHTGGLDLEGASSNRFRCSVVQCGAVWCSVVQCGAEWHSMVQFVAVCSRTHTYAGGLDFGGCLLQNISLQCVSVCCGLLQCFYELATCWWP